jgi:ABC-type oligopeptide transport system substrate-binding subunit
VKASDYVFAWQRVVDPKLASNYSYFPGLVGVKNADDIVAGKLAPTELGVKAIDDKTLEVTLFKPVPYFVKTLAHATLCQLDYQSGELRSRRTSSATAPMCWPKTSRASASR